MHLAIATRIPDWLLKKAYDNTVKLLLESVEVIE